jgi:LAO/AO transport system kinase
MSIADTKMSDRRALGRLLTRIENGQAEAELSDLFSRTGRAHIVGITGPPGAGKSTLLAALTREIRKRQQAVAIIAVDPTSPFSGGAILGDRIRMQGFVGDAGVFVRSMATRGALGGLAPRTLDMARALDAVGFDFVLIETVGAGQSEVDIVRAAQSVVVVEAPGMGDDIQAIKAGILEIADILVLNKADQPGADAAYRALRAMLDLGHRSERVAVHHGRRLVALTGIDADAVADENTSWQVPLLQTRAQTGDGVEALLNSLTAHHRYLIDTHLMRTREAQNLHHEITERLRDALLEEWLNRVDRRQLAALLDQVVAKQISPDSAVKSLVQKMDADPVLAADTLSKVPPEAGKP